MESKQEKFHRTTIKDWARTTSGSTGLDLSSSKHLIITPESEVILIPTGVYGPLSKGLMGLIIGRSSMSKAGIQVILVVIYSDYSGGIKIMIYPPLRRVQIFPQQQIAQLLLTYLRLPNQTLTQEHTGGCGSTNTVP